MQFIFSPVMESVFYEIVYLFLKLYFILIFLKVNQLVDSSKIWYTLVSTNTFKEISEYFHYWRSVIKQIFVVSIMCQACTGNWVYSDE